MNGEDWNLHRTRAAAKSMEKTWDALADAYQVAVRTGNAGTAERLHQIGEQLNNLLAEMYGLSELPENTTLAMLGYR